jgi:hypothetical protein
MRVVDAKKAVGPAAGCRVLLAVTDASTAHSPGSATTFGNYRVVDPETIGIEAAVPSQLHVRRRDLLGGVIHEHAHIA